MELLNALGLNVKVLLAQLVNFAILIFVLHRFAYQPILKMLEERRNKIELGIKNSEEAKKTLEEMKRKEEEIVAEAKKKAHEIVSRAEDMAKQRKEEILSEAKNKAEKVLALAETDLQKEKEKVIDEAKSEVASLALLMAEKIIVEKVNSDKDRKIIENIVK